MGLDVAWEYQCGFVGRYRRFGITCRLQLQISIHTRYKSSQTKEQIQCIHWICSFERPDDDSV